MGAPVRMGDPAHPPLLVGSIVLGSATNNPVWSLWVADGVWVARVAR